MFYVSFLWMSFSFILSGCRLQYFHFVTYYLLFSLYSTYIYIYPLLKQICYVRSFRYILYSYYYILYVLYFFLKLQHNLTIYTNADKSNMSEKRCSGHGWILANRLYYILVSTKSSYFILHHAPIIFRISALVILF